MAKRHTRVAFIKTAWSELYDGEEVKGKARHLSNGFQGHEKFNFRRRSTGMFYATMPPIGATLATPNPAQKDGWLLIFISAEEGIGPLKAVGWYEDAMFEDRGIPRPDYKSNPDFEVDDAGKPYTYCVSARRAHLIPVDERRSIPTIGDRMKRTPILYARGNNAKEQWRESLAKEAESLLRKPRAAKKRDSSRVVKNEQPWYATIEHRAAVDKQAVKHVKLKLSKQYHIQDRQADRCGYDLLATHKTSRNQFHVEVKGTSTERPGFFLTPKELAASCSPKWRLAVVTNALTRPGYRMFSGGEMLQTFSIKPCSYVGTFKRAADW